MLANKFTRNTHPFLTTLQSYHNMVIQKIGLTCTFFWRPKPWHLALTCFPREAKKDTSFSFILRFCIFFFFATTPKHNWVSGHIKCIYGSLHSKFPQFVIKCVNLPLCVLLFADQEANSSKGKFNEFKNSEDAHSEKQTKVSAQVC